MKLEKADYAVNPFTVHPRDNAEGFCYYRLIDSYGRGAFSFTHSSILKLLMNQVVRFTEKEYAQGLAPQLLTEAFLKLFYEF